MRYCITMEQTCRVAVYFDADDDEAAEEKASQINQKATTEDFEDGDEERDYALCNMDTGATILDWE